MLHILPGIFAVFQTCISVWAAVSSRCTKKGNSSANQQKLLQLINIAELICLKNTIQRSDVLPLASILGQSWEKELLKKSLHYLNNCKVFLSLRESFVNYCCLNISVACSGKLVITSIWVAFKKTTLKPNKPTSSLLWSSPSEKSFFTSIHLIFDTFPGFSSVTQ